MLRPILALVLFFGMIFYVVYDFFTGQWAMPDWIVLAVLGIVGLGLASGRRVDL